MRYSIGEQIGAMVAHLENDLAEDPDDIEAMRKLALTSEAYRNFSMGGLDGFQEDYVRGYQSVAKDLLSTEQHEQAEFERSLAAKRRDEISEPDPAP